MKRAYRWCSLFPDWKPGQREQWEAIQTQGRLRYVVLRGMVIYGVGCCFGWSLLWWFSQGAAQAFATVFLESLPLWIIGGYIFGESTWWGTSRSYAEHFGGDP